MAFLLALLEAVFGRLLGEELSARWPTVIDTLLRFAVRRLPKFYQSELEREWHSVLADLPGPLSKFFFAADLIRGAWWISFQEYRVTNQRDWTMFGGSLQVLAGAAGIWVLERVETLPRVKTSKVYRWVHLGLLTYMVGGFGTHAEAHLIAADRFANLGNEAKESENRSEADRLGEELLDRIIDVSVIYALHQLQESAAGDEPPSEQS
jgi:hypothetical protein